MACQDNYIQLDRTTTARSGLYASDLPGVEISLLEGLTKEDHDDYLETWEMIYGRSWTNLVSDITTALQKKFFVDRKLLSRETSKFSEEVNSGSGLAGVRIRFDLPKYARIHVLSIGVYSEDAHNSPGINFEFYDTDADGDLLYEQDEEIIVGQNTINIDRDFEVSQLFIAYDRSTADFRKTENKHFPLGQGWIHWDKVSCMSPCAWGGTGEVRQIEEGGLNVKFIIECSIEKYICENINFFKTALWYRIGLELTAERRFGNRLNEFTTMTQERATELFDFFNTEYQKALNNAIQAVNIDEDPFCFNCRKSVTVKTNLP